jgi:isopenicillin N synthase-like dioxygenase
VLAEVIDEEEERVGILRQSYLRRRELREQRERYAIAFFLDPNPDADIACLPGCASATNPPRYAPIRGDAFLLSRLSPTYEKSGLGAARAVNG